MTPMAIIAGGIGILPVRKHFPFYLDRAHWTFEHQQVAISMRSRVRVCVITRNAAVAFQVVRLHPA